MLSLLRELIANAISGNRQKISRKFIILRHCESSWSVTLPITFTGSSSSYRNCYEMFFKKKFKLCHQTLGVGRGMEQMEISACVSHDNKEAALASSSSYI
jgi:hypothetical protein